MKLLPKTWALLAIAVVLAAANAYTASPAAAPPVLPSLPAVVPDDVTKVVISSPIDRLELDRTAFEKGHPEAERWQIVAPLDYPADVAQVRTLIRTFGLGVPMDARVDSGNLKDYQLEDQDARVVELYTNAATPALQVMVGRTVGPEASFVRLPGSTDVYRAAVGPRQRYDQAAADWRDRVVLDVAPERITGIRLQHGADTLQLARDGAVWTLDGAPADAEVASGLAKALGRIRAGDIHNGAFPGGFDAPLAVATLEAGPEVHTVTLGGASTATSAYLRVDARPDVYQVSGALGRMLTQPAVAFRDHTLFAFKADDIAALAFTQGAFTVAIARSDTGWTVTQPANMDVDAALADGLAAALAGMRAAGVPPDASFPSAAGRLDITLRDGTRERLELGAPEQDPEGHAFVRVRGRAGVFLLRAGTAAEIARVFGR